MCVDESSATSRLMFPSKRARYEADHEADDDDSFLPVGVTPTSGESE